MQGRIAAVNAPRLQQHVAAEDQSPVVAYLASGHPFGEAGVDRRIDTHAASVFLSGERAWKLKRAVRYPYLDFSTPEKRRAALEAELRLNRRTAPDLYLAVHPITRSGDELCIGGAGEIVDWVLEMKRFADGALLDELAAQGPIDPSILLRLAKHVHTFHDGIVPTIESHGANRLRDIIEGNASSLGVHADLFGGDRISRLVEEQCRACERHAALLDARGREGRIRHVHGDLHLANIALIEGEPVPFDCLEFSEELSTIDVLYDLAFLLMDLWHRGLRAGANLVFNHYIDLSADEEGVRLLPLFLSMRATIRAHVLATTVARGGSAATPKQATDFLAFAERLITPRSAGLVAVGGLSGTGKSVLARALGGDCGAPPGARILRSDVLRKRLAGISSERRLSPALYTPRANRTVYELLGTLTSRHLASGTFVIADAVFADDEERGMIAHCAAHAHVPFFGLWLEAPEPIRLSRVARRTADPSDADADVVRAQSSYRTGALGEWHRLRADRLPTAVASDARAIVAGTG